MKITHLLPHMDQEASGPFYSVPRLCQSLATCGNEVELKCLAASRQVDGIQLNVYRQWPGTANFAVSTAMARALRQAARDVDIVHNHSLWSMSNIAAGWVVPGHRAKLVTSPRGTLSTRARARSKRRKQILWPLQKRALTHADLLHATSEAEYQDIRALGFEAPVAVIPNGIDLPPDRPSANQHGLRTLLYLGRIHPIKGIDRLLHAWQQMEHRYPGWRLSLVGTGEAEHLAAATGLAKSLKLQRVAFPGPLYGIDKSTAYHDADLFVLPSHTENFGMVVAEALAHGCPAIVAKGAPWSGLETEACGWWIDNDVASLAGTLAIALGTSSDTLHAMGARGRRWMERDFSWRAIGAQMSAAYAWLVLGGNPPPWIKLRGA